MSDVVHALRQETATAAALLANLKDLIGDDADLAANTIESETDLHEAIASGLKRLMELNALMNGIADMIANLKDRGERLERQSDTIRTAIATAMESANLKRFEHGLGTISLKAVPPKALILDEAAIPLKFWKPSDPKLDKKAVLGALKAKEEVPGASLSNGSMTIAIKVD